MKLQKAFIISEELDNEIISLLQSYRFSVCDALKSPFLYHDNISILQCEEKRIDEVIDVLKSRWEE